MPEDCNQSNNSSMSEKTDEAKPSTATPERQTPTADGFNASESKMESRYGWLKYRPAVLQKLKNAKWILFCLCLASAIQGMVVNGFVNVVISNIERRFDLKSTETGLIASCYDIAAVVCLIPVSYFGGLGRKPRYVAAGVLVLGIGSAVFSLPHFLTDVYLISSSKEAICLQSNTTNSFCDTSGASKSLSLYKYLFFLGQLLHGAGASPLYTLGITYMDENLSRQQSPLYIGIFYAMSIVGPAIGYLAGGSFVDIYTDYQSVDVKAAGLDSSNPKWVGAWWIGFLLSAALAASAAFPISGFPVYLPKRDKYAVEKGIEVFATKKTTAHCAPSPDKASVKHILKSIKALVLNPTFMFLNLAAASEGLILSGFSTFTPKFIESQFLLASGTAAKYVGLAVIPAGGGGTFLGGYLVKKLNLRINGILRLCISCSFTCVFFMLVFLVQCDVMPFAGVNSPYMVANASALQSNRKSLNLNHDCNEDCGCQRQVYSPVCGDNKVVFHSPCYAGCQQALKHGANKIFRNCTCIPSTKASTMYGGAVDGKCESNCQYLKVFMPFFAVMILLTFITSMPALQATLRCLPLQDRSLGLGIQWIIARSLGSIPGPILFGKVIDVTCTLWQEKCDEQGSCRSYDNKDMGTYLMAISIVGKCLSSSFFFLSLFFYRGPKQEVNDSPAANSGVELLSTKKISEAENNQSSGT